MEFYGGEDWRKNEGAGMIDVCIKRLVEEELVMDYLWDSEPDEETRYALEERVGAKWREDQGLAGKSYILGIIKEERNQKSENRKEEEKNQESGNTKEEEINQESENTKEEES